ncbi:RNA polymerase sigma-70 factor, ECF subfamily [Mucilaginibacter lappiensis]|nr:RNA polymerase sigma-70 factor, ECF subfamily [Mucilaginibacter lappiensis]
MKNENGHADSIVIMNLKKNDDIAMIMLYELYWKKLYLSAYKILKDEESCKDIVQDVLIKIWSNRAQLSITTGLYNYAAAAVRYEVYRKIRDCKRYEPIIDEIVNALPMSVDIDSLEQKELELQIASFVSALPPKCKEVYILSRNEHLSHKEIAGKLAISTKTVRNHLTRALQELRVNIQQLYFVIFLLIFK